MNDAQDPAVVPTSKRELFWLAVSLVGIVATLTLAILPLVGGLEVSKLAYTAALLAGIGGALEFSFARIRCLEALLKQERKDNGIQSA